MSPSHAFKPKSREISYAHNLFCSSQIALKFCTEHGCITGDEPFVNNWKHWGTKRWPFCSQHLFSGLNIFVFRFKLHWDLFRKPQMNNMTALNQMATVHPAGDWPFSESMKIWFTDVCKHHPASMNRCLMINSLRGWNGKQTDFKITPQAKCGPNNLGLGKFKRILRDNTRT